MATIDMTLQGKGGVGKSYAASLLAQHYLERGETLLCFDTDPVNRTFEGYAAYSVEGISLGESAEEINPRNFDTLVERIFEAPDNAVIVIDNGSSGFLPLTSYLVENQVVPMLQEAGHTLRLHSVVTGGQALDDTLHGLNALLDHFSTPVVVWLNEYFGQVMKNGKRFEDSALFERKGDRIHALVHLSALRKETFGADIEAMLKARQTFADSVTDSRNSIMTRQRLKTVWRAIRAELERANL